MNNIGILAYGSIINNLGEEIESSIVNRIINVMTPLNRICSFK
jgi:hypothetical protein